LTINEHCVNYVTLPNLKSHLRTGCENHAYPTFKAGSGFDRPDVAS